MIQGFFLPAATGGRFCMECRPTVPDGRAVLIVQPFAEEANKSRSNLARIARACAEDGVRALIVDPVGTGDSAGDFGDADWRSWVEDIARAATWLRAQGAMHLTVLGLRAGCLLACDALAAGVVVERLIWVAPQASGKQALTQFLRIGAAAELDAQGGARIDTRALRNALERGESVEIAGYRLAPGLALGLEAARLEPPAAFRGRVDWIEVSSVEGAELSPGATLAIGRWREGGCEVRAEVLRGPAFWQTQEIEEVPGLPAACVAALREPAEACA